MTDILFKSHEYVFSYRVAGICVQDGKVLLQKPTNDIGFAFPGGHVSFGETNEQTLIREFKEEIGVDIEVSDLKWVGEIFFPWGEKPCHQICLYYIIKINEGNIAKDGVFMAQEQIEGRDFKIEFHWVPIDKIAEIELYPINCKELLTKIDGDFHHFVYRE